MQKIENVNDVYLMDLLLSIIAQKPKHSEEIAETKLYSALENTCKNGSRGVLEKLLLEIQRNSEDRNVDFVYSVSRGYMKGSKKNDGIYIKLNNDQVMAINDTISGFYSESVIGKLKEVSKKVWDEYSKLN